MPKDWALMTLQEKAADLLEMTDLHEDDFQAVYDEWATHFYDQADPKCETRALADLQRIVMRHIVGRAGKTQAEAERVRAFISANVGKVK